MENQEHIGTQPIDLVRKAAAEILAADPNVDIRELNRLEPSDLNRA